MVLVPAKGDVEVRVKVYVASDMSRPFLTFDDKGASGHMPGAVLMRNPYGAAAKFILSKRDPEREAKKVAQAIAHEIGKFMAAQEESRPGSDALTQYEHRRAKRR